MSSTTQAIQTAIFDEAAKKHPASVAGYRIRTANERLTESHAKRDPDSLFMNIWNEGELCVLFSDTNVGKSVLAVQIAEQIAKQQLVTYFDLENTDKQFESRNRDDDTKSLIPFDDNLLIIDNDPEADDDDDEAVDEKAYIAAEIDRIKAVVEAMGAKVVIIDNMSWIINSTEKGDIAGGFIKRLKRLKSTLDLSVLVVGHTPKINQFLGRRITTDSLAGSKRLINFVDSAFAVGRSEADPDHGRYIIQIKSRSNYGIQYGTNHVITATLSKTNPNDPKDKGRLRLWMTGHSTEDEQLRRDFADADGMGNELRQKAAELKEQGKSVRAIAAEMGLSKSKVDRMLQKAADTSQATAPDNDEADDAIAPDEEEMPF